MKKKKSLLMGFTLFGLICLSLVLKTKESKALIICDEYYGGIGVCCIQATDGTCNALGYSGWYGPFYTYPGDDNPGN